MLQKVGLLASHTVIWILFTMIYAIMDKKSPGVHYGKNFNPMYFSTVTHVTIGYGDFSPKTSIAQSVVMMHATLSSLATILFI